MGVSGDVLLVFWCCARWWCLSGAGSGGSVDCNGSAMTVCLRGVSYLCGQGFKLALSREGVEGEKAKGDQCCSTFRLQGLWPIYTATWLSLRI